MAPTLPRLTSGAALSLSSSLSSSASPKPDVITLSSSSDDAPGADDVIILSSSSEDELEASSWKGSSSAGSKDGPVVLTSSDSDPDAQLLAECRKRRPSRNVAWVFSDEVKILTALADERHESGQLLGSRSAQLDAIRSRVDLERQNPTAGDVAKKVHNLKERFRKAVAAGGPRNTLRDRKLYELAKNVWPELL